MNRITGVLLSLALMAIQHSLSAQTRLSILDKLTLEPIAGATIETSRKSFSANESGEIILNEPSQSIRITRIGYHSVELKLDSSKHITAYMEQKSADLQQVVLSANRQMQKRTKAPVAISLISTSVLQETKPTSIDQVLNKVSGVFMVNLGNEQHSMSIRQPMSTKSLYLYLEDGIPIRTSGVFNHNALLEMNMAAVKNIEVIRGPSSSMYGGEAIGGAVNFITLAAPQIASGKISLQGNTVGYKRIDINAGNTIGKLGISVNGYYANNSNGTLEYSDFSKFVGTIRADYQFNENTKISNSISLVDYRSDMRGALDSAAYSKKDYSTLHSFTYRNVYALRAKSQLTHDWNKSSTSSLAFIFRDNSIDQNPAYYVRDDHRRVNGQWRGNKMLAHGEINDNFFKSYAVITTHRQKSIDGRLESVSGIWVDYSPAGYYSNYISIRQDSISREYLGYENRRDSLLSDYTTDILNLAVFSQFDYELKNNFHLVAGFRYDMFRMKYRNALAPSAFSGAPNSDQNFYRFTPKLGFTWQAKKQLGFYANYSEGFVAPQITELFRGVKVPDLKPQTFFNYEVGGWMSLIKEKIYADWSGYWLDGSNEIITVRTDDGTYANANAGKTRHRGIEYGITARASDQIKIRFSAAHAKHEFKKFSEKEINYSGNEMNNAPRFQANAELSFKPKFLPGARASVEWQHMGSYWMDPLNTTKYPGFDVINIRTGYNCKSFEVWFNILNVTNRYYAVFASKSAFGQNYNIGEPIAFNIGVAYSFRKLK